MARSRSLPSNLFEDPDFFELGSDMQIILVGLVLGADDAGRGLAHSGLLARKLNKDVALIEQALSALEERGLLICYQVERQRYYCLTRWQEWETLSRPTPSKHPAPPSQTVPTREQQSPEIPQNPTNFPGDFVETPSEGEGEEEEEEKRKEGEGEVTPSNVLTFPTARTDGTTGSIRVLSEQEIREISKQLSSILKLSETAALTRIVQEYGQDPMLSLLGEADAAREWIDDKHRNRNGQRMTEAFFRRWLRREHEDALHRQQQREQTRATGTAGKEGADTTRAGLPQRSLMDLEQQYKAARGRRAVEKEQR